MRESERSSRERSKCGRVVGKPIAAVRVLLLPLLDAQLTPPANNQKHLPCRSSRRWQQRRRRRRRGRWHSGAQKKCVEIHAQLHLSCLEDCFAKVRLKVLAVTADNPPPPHMRTLHCVRVRVWVCAHLQRNTKISRVFISLCALLVFDSFSCLLLGTFPIR